MSISDTGPGIKMPDFLHSNRSFNNADDTYLNSPDTWDGVLKIITTDAEEDEVQHYQLTCGNSNASNRPLHIGSSPKARRTFSGTEASLSVQGNLEQFVLYIKDLCQKISILKMSTIALELCLEQIDNSKSLSEILFMSNEGTILPKSMSTIDCLSSGIMEFKVKHGHVLDKQTHESCAFRDCFRIGKGITYRQEVTGLTENVLEVVLVLEIADTTGPSCLVEHIIKAKVLYFEDYFPSTVTPPTVQALSSVNWLKYGLTLRGIQVDNFGDAVIELEGMQTVAGFDIVLHKYQKKCLKKRKKTSSELKTIKDSLGMAMDELKESNPEHFLSQRASKMKAHAPELSRSISGLIMSSNDMAFKEECVSILGLPPTDLHQEILDHWIKQRILDIIEMTDRNPNKIVQNTYEEPWNREQEEEDDNEENVDECRSIWDFL